MSWNTTLKCQVFCHLFPKHILPDIWNISITFSIVSWHNETCNFHIKTKIFGSRDGESILVLISTICNEVSGRCPSQLNLCTNLLLDIKYSNMHKAISQTFYLPLLHCTCISMCAPQKSYFSGLNLFLLHPGSITGAISPSKVRTHAPRAEVEITCQRPFLSQGSLSPWPRLTASTVGQLGSTLQPVEGISVCGAGTPARMQGTSILALRQDLGDF